MHFTKEVCFLGTYRCGNVEMLNNLHIPIWRVNSITHKKLDYFLTIEGVRKDQIYSYLWSTISIFHKFTSAS